MSEDQTSPPPSDENASESAAPEPAPGRQAAVGERPAAPTRQSSRGDVTELAATTTRLFADCLLPNGALIEAPAHQPFYPVGARDTLRCRPGIDAAFAILAMDALGRDVRSPLLRWLHDRAGGFRDDGLLHHAYRVPGTPEDEHRDLLGTALLLYAINRRRNRARGEIAEEVSRGLASALAVRWDGQQRRFRDYPEYRGVLGAADMSGAESALRAAGMALEVDAWTRVADAIGAERFIALEEILSEEAVRRDGASRDGLITACLALAWPFAEGHREQAVAVARLAERTMATPEPSERTAPHEDHGPLRAEDAVRLVELFRLATALAAAGETFDAERYFDAALATADESGHFPAAADPADLEPSPRPYLLAHLTFNLAAEALGHLAAVPGGDYPTTPPA